MKEFLNDSPFRRLVVISAKGSNLLDLKIQKKKKVIKLNLKMHIINLVH